MLNNFKKTNKKSNFLKIISTILLSFFIFNIFSINKVSAEENGKKRYESQIKDFCERYKVEEITHKSEPYFEEDSSGEERLFNKAKEKYRENQNAIYSCSVIKLQKNSFKVVKDKLVNIDKGGTLKSRIIKKLELKVKKLDRISEEKECIFPQNKEEGNSLQFKNKLLNESAYEFCKYSFYLNFLQNHYKNIENANLEYLGKTEATSFKVSKLAQIQSKLQQDIIDELTHSQKVFSIAFETYIDYENNHPVHILLELIKEDFTVLRRKLHEALSPINQVVYKISNAMSIH